MTVAYAGERGAFGELAAAQYFGKQHALISHPEFSDVFKAVGRGAARYGIVPIENSMAGSIHQNYDLLLQNKLHITGEIFLRVSQFLLANRGVTMRSVKRLFSHPQAFAQCHEYMKSLRGVEIVPVSNTATAVKMIKDNRLTDAAAIGSMQAAIDYDMTILARRIEDNRQNTTRFIILSRKPLPRVPIGRPAKTSIVFSTRNMPGALFRALSVFALRDINLLKIESRPMREGNFDYLFYLDFAGDARDEAQRNALNHLQEITALYRLFGSYPVGRLAHPEYRKRR